MERVEGFIFFLLRSGLAISALELISVSIGQALSVSLVRHLSELHYDYNLHTITIVIDICMQVILRPPRVVGEISFFDI